jgi:UDPglucose--hexose-1-phosphate uridylyltransferase
VISPSHPTSQLRYDPFLDSWVIYASHRQDRSFLPDPADCPLCPSNAVPSERGPRAQLRGCGVREPLSALVTGAGKQVLQLWPGSSGVWGDLLPERAAAGRCEVVCYAKDHDFSFAELAPERVDLVVEALVARSKELGSSRSRAGLLL